MVSERREKKLITWRDSNPLPQDQPVLAIPLSRNHFPAPQLLNIAKKSVTCSMETLVSTSVSFLTFLASTTSTSTLYASRRFFFIGDANFCVTCEKFEPGWRQSEFAIGTDEEIRDAVCFELFCTQVLDHGHTESIQRQIRFRCIC